ncbi:MAG: hypothetical protein V1872_00380 [bacterium]
MPKINDREKLIIFIIICIGTIFLWHRILYLPKKTELKRIKDEIKRIEKDSERLTLEIAELGEQGKKERIILQRYTEQVAKIPSIATISSISEQMVKDAKDKDIRIVSMVPIILPGSKQREEMALKEIYLDIVLEGDYLDLAKYIMDLAELPFLNGYQKFRINSDKEVYPMVEAEIGCNLLFFNLPVNQLKTSNSHFDLFVDVPPKFASLVK